MQSSPRTALIFGISGQDGAYLARLLLDQGYAVHGSSRDAEGRSFPGLAALGIRDRVKIHSASLGEFRSVAQIVQQIRPSEIFNLAAQSSVGLSFQQPVETIDSIMHGTINILEAIRFLGLETRFYNASSSECFGNTPVPADETMPFQPRSPYAVGKAAAHWAVANYREAYDLFACSGLLFNHESPLRPARFVTQKIVRGAADIAERKTDRLALGALDMARDWGWAADYAEAMALMLQQDAPEDFVIATGVASRLEDFVDAAFRCFGLDWRTHVESDPAFMRPSDISLSVGNPAKARAQLGWSATIKMPDLVAKLVEAELAKRAAAR